MPLSLHTVDVFASEPFSGNPLAVVGGGEALDTAAMQRLTRWFNLSETTFLLPPTQPEADYRVRIFALVGELPFAGHPTLGTCHAWLEAGNTPKTPGVIVQECAAGLVTIRQQAGRLAFAAPPLLRSGKPTPAELAEACRFLGIAETAVVDAAWIDNGPGWLGIRLDGAESVLALKPAGNWERRMDIGVVGPHEPGGDAAFEVRAFFSDHTGTTVEDPVTGSLNASIAQWLRASGVVEGGYVAAQGTRLGRRGRVHVDYDETGQAWIGGATRTHVAGRLDAGG
ncbi:MAG: phenazine biosynthesis protein PhzF [Mesorhizobium amorphae]|nr:MAG: phenazine biosynthesis protein PhzF [Mesorhizobium amorphae]